MNTQTEPSSFRDPSGSVFYIDGEVHRQVNTVYRDHYELLMQSGLYQKLVDAYLLVPHHEVDSSKALTDAGYKVIRPERIVYVSYPYEWCFEQLKDAALATLKIQKLAFAHGLVLKDASAYNIQFHNGRAVLIDTLSFERYEEGEPWIAYKQFCQHFFGPLALMAFKDVRLGLMSRDHIDGVPLDLTSALLPIRTWLYPSVLMHIHLHALSQNRASGASTSRRKEIAKTRLSKAGFSEIIDSLERGIKRMRWRPGDTEWGNYYASTNYDSSAMQHKRDLVAAYIERLSPAPRMAIDLGANTGVFSRVAAESGASVISMDIDPLAVQKNYTSARDGGERNIHPLLIDLTNPSPALGWAHEERMSLHARGEVDLILALALVHHLAITNNLPFSKIAQYFASLGRNAIIELPLKQDSQVEKLLASRKDVFQNYGRGAFEDAFEKSFDILDSTEIEDSDRIMYLMARKS